MLKYFEVILNHFQFSHHANMYADPVRDCPIIFIEQKNKIKFVLTSCSSYLEILWKKVLLTKYYIHNTVKGRRRNFERGGGGCWGYVMKEAPPYNTIIKNKWLIFILKTFKLQRVLKQHSSWIIPNRPTSIWVFENKKQSCLMLLLNLCGIVAQHDDLDWIKHLSNSGMVAKSTT